MKLIFELKEDILYCTYPDIYVNLDVAKSFIEDRIEYIGDNTYPSLFDVSRNKGVSKEARDCLSNGRALNGISAAAVVSSSIFTTFIANFFLRVSAAKSPFPTMLFTDKEKAVEWLKQYV